MKTHARPHPALRGLPGAGAVLALLLSSNAGGAKSPPAEPTVEDLLNRTDDLMRGKSSVGTVTMHVKTARWDRKLTLKSWSKGTDKTLIVIEAPAKEKGTATLKVDQDIWNYLPKVDRTIKVPASMMSGSWMGSHFTNDDLVRESRFVDDFTCTMESRPKDNPQQHYVIACVPRPDAPVVWGKVVARVRGSDQLPDNITYFDEKGTLVRTMTYDEVKKLGDRTIPTHMKLVPADKPDEFTEMSYGDLKFDIDLPDSTFTLQALKR
ncbi:MAG: outer membrane lipoprotein-sorting protein [Deltaproteobacteria bacterium]|nr:outer membrane lipoprotein-sorting protein [Deltaproteobacteria bacterium]